MSSTLKLPKSPAIRFAETEAFNALGEAAFAEFHAVRVPGKVVWCNFELLRELGFDVPQSNQLTPAFEEQLLAKFSLQSLLTTNDASGKEIVTLYADRYGGDGVTPALGAGRAGFLREANLYVKGLGFTPLFRHNDKDDFVHSHGGVHFEDCLSEAIFGEVDHNLFELGASRIVAIIDQGKFVTDPAGRQRPIAIAVRTGAQLRPGHFLAKRVRGSRSPLEMLISITHATGQLVSQNDSGLPDLSATMLRVIDDHARTAADSFRWRMIHGALSPSNMDISGAMLDLPTQSTQPRTAPIFMLDYVQSAYGTEHKERGFYLAEMYRRILRATDAPTRARFNLKWINVSNEMDLCYRKHLEIRLLAATGLKTHVAQDIQRQSRLAERFANVLLVMTALKNAGRACVARKVVSDLSVVDVFGLLAGLPRDFFGHKDLKMSVLKRAQPIYKGNRFHVRANQRRLEQMADEFAGVYRELMNFAARYYDSRAAIKRSITTRAAFENQPLDGLYCHSLYEDLSRAIAEYQTTSNAQVISDAIDTRITQSLRCVDRLLARGSSPRTIRGIAYSIRSGKLHVSIRVEAQGNRFLTGVPGLEALTKRQIQQLRYRFTTGRKTFNEARGRLVYDRHLGAIIDFGDLESSALIGRLEGSFHTADLSTPLFSDYVFALPDS
ncbi:MAG TPA: hypothetical protein VGJ37_16710 [Pyrinomonadaceae bacterium]